MKRIISLKISLSKQDWFFLINTLDEIVIECSNIEEKHKYYHQYLEIKDAITQDLLEQDYLKYY